MQNIKLLREVAKIWKVESDLANGSCTGIKGYDLDVTNQKVTVKKIHDPRFVREVSRSSLQIGQSYILRDGQQIVCRVSLLK